MEKGGRDTRQALTGVHLWLLMWKSTRALEMQARRSVEATGMCLSDFGVLEALLHKGPLLVSALGRKVLLTSGSMTAAVDRLERLRLVERKTAGADRRARVVHLTETGTVLIQRVFEGHVRDMERAFSCLGAAERRTLAALLRKVGLWAETLSGVREESLGSKNRRS